jgi:hypothetical protein
MEVGEVDAYMDPQFIVCTLEGNILPPDQW